MPIHNALSHAQNSFSQKNADLNKHANWKLLWMKMSCMGFNPKIKQQCAGLIMALMKRKQLNKSRIHKMSN